jgi:hypothetical protein
LLLQQMHPAFPLYEWVLTKRVSRWKKVALRAYAPLARAVGNEHRLNQHFGAEVAEEWIRGKSKARLHSDHDANLGGKPTMRS